MRRRDARAKHPRWWPAGWLLVLLLPAAVLAQQPRAPEYQVKLAFLYQFLKYVQWPPQAAEGPLDVCVAGQNPFGSRFFDIMSGAVNGRDVKPHAILSPEDVCDVIFVPRTANERAYLNAAAGTPTLIVGESAGFLRRGGMIQFVEIDAKVRFAIAVERAKSAGIGIDPSLLRLRVPDPGGVE